ncbi:hypothetical protein Gotur_028465 [Gossypium turneri]
MALPSSPPIVQSATPVMASNLSDGVFDNLFLFTKKISIFLDDNNYLLWHQQVLLSLKIYELQHFLDSHNSLASWFLSSVSQKVLPHLISMCTSAQIWTALENLYGNKTTSQLMFYRRALHSQHKGDLSMKEFLIKIKGYCYNLASCGEVISEHEHVTAILNGLSPEYEYVVTVITASQIPYSVQGVTTMLLDAEAQQLVTIRFRGVTVTMVEAPSSANMVIHQQVESVVNSMPTPAYRSTFSSRGCGCGRSSGSRIQCQICRKTCHLVDRCYYRFDFFYNSVGYKPPLQENMCTLGNSPPIALWIPSSLPMMGPIVPSS